MKLMIAVTLTLGWMVIGCSGHEEQTASAFAGTWTDDSGPTTEVLQVNYAGEYQRGSVNSGGQGEFRFQTAGVILESGALIEMSCTSCQQGAKSHTSASVQRTSGEELQMTEVDLGGAESVQIWSRQQP